MQDCHGLEQRSFATGDPEGPVLRSRGLWLVTLALAVSSAGCDQLGIDTPQKQAERKHAEAKAIGGACRHALRAIEDCYTLNPRADKSAVYEGWREMDEYMRENKLEGIAPVVPRPDPKPKRPPSVDGEEVVDDPAQDSGLDRRDTASKPE